MEAMPMPASEPVFKRPPVVVFVDDEPEILSSVRRLLRREPYKVLTTESPRRALDWVRDRDISIVVADLRMPEMSGAELLASVRRHAPATLRLLLTAHPESGLIFQGLQGDIQWLLGKPWNEGGLRQTLLQLLNERERLDSGRSPHWTEDPDEEARPVVPVDCWGKTAEEVLDDVASVLDEGESRGTFRIVLRDLTLLKSSIPRFLKDLGRRIALSGAHVSVQDESGYLQAFLSALDPVPVTSTASLKRRRRF